MAKPEPTTFEQLVSSLDTGEPGRRFTQDWRELLAKLTARAEDDDKASGSMTLTLKVHVTRKGEIEITPDSATKVPKAPASKMRRWLTPEGALVARDPRQIAMNLKDAPGASVHHLDPNQKAGS